MLCTRGQVSTRKGEALWALKGPQDAGRSRETGPVSYLSHQAWAPCLRDGQVGQGPGAPPAWVSQKPAPWVVSGHPRPRWEGRRQEPHLSQHLFARSLGWSCPRKGHQGAWPVAQGLLMCDVQSMPGDACPWRQAVCHLPALTLHGTNSVSGLFMKSSSRIPPTTPALPTPACPSEADNRNQVVPSLCVYLHLFHKTRLRCFSLIFFPS